MEEVICMQKNVKCITWLVSRLINGEYTNQYVKIIFILSGFPFSYCKCFVKLELLVSTEDVKIY